MKYENIADIYAANDKIQTRLKDFVSNLTDEEVEFLPEGEKWTIKQLVEHIATVAEGMTKVSAKLLSQSDKKVAAAAAGKVNLSENFLQKVAEAQTLKFEAPERLHPTGVQSIAESLAKLEENKRRLEELRPLFESVECSDFKFPHPFMGELTAHEWLALVGGHQARHLRQIEKILARAREESN